MTIRFNLVESLLSIIAVASFIVEQASADCLANEGFNEFFEGLNGGVPIPTEGSCCQKDVCNIPCPEEVSDPAVGFAVAVGICIVISFLIGLSTYFFVQGEAENYFVAGHSLPLWIVAMTLAAQSVDSNSLLGNVDLSYKFQFFDGAAIPIGLGLSLILNSIFLAGKINGENVLTLPDVLARRYGKLVEILVSMTTICSFLMLLAGNLVGMGVITSYVWGISESAGIWLAAAIVWCYTVTGGLFSVAYTDVVQGLMGWPGCIVCAFWFIANSVSAPEPSIGAPGYVYPNEEICELYDGIPCTTAGDTCCYNEALWCPSDDNCVADNGAFPIGDQRIFSNQMFDPYALTPFPNAMYWNWCTIFILAFGNLGALDFQVRCMAAKTPNTARIGCLIGGCFTFFIGIPFAYLGAITRFYYGPDSPRALFDTDTCSTILGLPTCGAWIPDNLAFIKLLTNEAPGWIGAWCLIGIVAASMSTADGAILAMGTVFSHNLLRQLDPWWPNLVTSDNLLLTARLATIPFTLTATLIGAYYKTGGDSASSPTGYLLIVAFDIVLATVVAPLIGCFYAKNPSPRAALCSVVSGALTRIILEFALPKDGYLLLPYGSAEFDNYGEAASTMLPTFFNGTVGEDVWDPGAEECDQEKFRDFTGVDSLSAFAISVLVFVVVQMIENSRGGEALFTLPGMEPYEKNLSEGTPGEEVKDPDETLKTSQAAAEEPDDKEQESEA